MIDWLRKEQMEPEIELDGRTLPIELKRHARARRLTLRLAPDGSAVRLTLPQWARTAEAIAFAHSRTEWLGEQLAKIPKRLAPGPGSGVQFRGRDAQIAWDEKAPRKPKLDGDRLIIGGPKAGLETRLQRWLEKEALGLFEGDVADYTTAAALDTVPVGISRAQRRWGSCSDGGAGGTKRIRLNWRLLRRWFLLSRRVFLLWFWLLYFFILLLFD